MVEVFIENVQNQYPSLIKTVHISQCIGMLAY